MTEKQLHPKHAIAALTKSPHGRLAAYVPVGLATAKEDPDFFAHLMAWNATTGQIRDSKLALPMLALASGTTDEVYLENALAHLASLRPRELLRALQFAADLRKGIPATLATMKIDTRGTLVQTSATPAVPATPVPAHTLGRLVARYLRNLEADRKSFEYTAVQHKKTLHALYAHYHVQRPAWVGEILFHGEKGQPKAFPGGVFSVIRQLSTMDPVLAAGMATKYHIPYLIAQGAMGKKACDIDAQIALTKLMSATDLVTNAAKLEKSGVETNPALRAALAEALKKAETSTKATLKATRAAEALGDSPLAQKLHGLQEKQLDTLAGIEGDWLVLGDKSGSMARSIAGAVQMAAFLARSVKGKVHLIFFDVTPRYFDVTGLTLQEITRLTSGIVANGGTHMHVGLQYMLDKGWPVDGIVLIGDGMNNSGAPRVLPVYEKYCEKMGNEPPLYFFRLETTEPMFGWSAPGQADAMFGWSAPGQADDDYFTKECKAAQFDLQTFDLRGQAIDFYSMPGVTSMLRASRYSLMDDIMATTLLSLDDVLKLTKGVYVLPRVLTTA